MSTKLVSEQYKLHLAEQLLESISEQSNTIYYVFVGNHIPTSNDTVPSITTSYKETVVDVYRNMIFGKRITSSDAKLMIRNIPYVANTLYYPYDDSDEELLTKNYYAIVNESSFYHVYKCLDNNGNKRSTITPTFADISGSNTEIYQTSDGYRWKYMYSVSSSDKTKFATSEYFPVISNTSVVNSAVEGSIDIVRIENAGSGYDNYLTGIFQSSDIRINGDDLVYNISNTQISLSNGFYTGCLIYLSGGVGQGQYKKIVNYYTTNVGNYIVLDSKFDVVPTNLTEYQINPSIDIISDGTQTVNAVARALVNSSSSNSIYRIEMIERGRGYKFASANVVANAVVGVTVPASIRPIYSPYGGHGFSAAEELNSTRMCMSITFFGNESNLIPFGNEYKQIGIIRDPSFSNVKFEMQSLTTQLVSNEVFYKVNPVFHLSGATANQFTTNITHTVGDFNLRFSSGDRLLLSSNGSYQIVNVASVVNSSLLTLSANSAITGTNVSIYIANTSAVAQVKDILDGSTFLAYNLYGDFASNDTIIGATSGSYGAVNLISRNDVYKNFTTFVQAYKYLGNAASGVITMNEVIRQATNSGVNATAYVHSSYYDSSNVMLYLTNVTGGFQLGNTIIGNTSSGSATLTKIYTPELTMNSGDIMFLENIEAVTRQSTQKETLKIIYEF